VHAVSTAAIGAAAFWTPARMAAATALQGRGQASVKGTSVKGTSGQAPKIGPPPGTPTASAFRGVPTVGPLFYTTGSGAHFCTASVVDSAHQDLIVTAAHCVYGSGYATNIEFVPGYHDGRRPYGTWLVQAVVVARAWRQRHDPDLDFAFLTVVDPAHPARRIQRVTGGLWLGIGRGYAHWMRLIGYNDAIDDPVKCESRSHQFRVGQMVFFCRGFRTGTSGGPWVLGFTSRGTGTLFGVIGGYQEGGRYDWASYSPVLGATALALYRQAETTAALQLRRLPAPRPQAHGDHRERELAVCGLRLAVQEVADPGEEPGPFGLLHDQEVRVRADRGQQGIGGTGLAVPELAHLGRGEQVRSLPEHLLLPGLGRAAAPRGQRDAGPALAHLGQPGDPADPVVVHVPQAGEHAARPEHPGDLRQRAVHVKPVHGLASQHGVQARIGQRDVFRAPRHRTHLGYRPPQLGQHLRVGFYRGHLGT
jgi:hypothetical protein